MWFFGLLLFPVSVALLYLAVRSALTTLAHVGATTAFLGSALAAAGNGIEFQLGSDAGFMLFGLGFAAFAGGMVTFGVGLNRLSQSKETWIAIPAVGVAGFLSSIAGPIGLIGATLFIVSWAIIAVRPPRTYV